MYFCIKKGVVFMTIEEINADKVSGGQVVETKDNKFILVPPEAKFYNTKEEVEKAETDLKECLKKGPHHDGHGHGYRQIEISKPGEKPVIIKG